jgi:uncharacterized peroxidase-related enzyme
MFLASAPESDAASRLFQKDMEGRGFVMNFNRVWAWRADIAEAFLALRGQLTASSTLTPRDLAVLVCTTASSLGDSYCSLAWGKTLAGAASPKTAAAVLKGSEDPDLSPRELALARWAAQMVTDPNATTARDVEALRAAGLSEKEIFEASVFVAFRLAFSTVNDALGVAPDHQVAEAAPVEVRTAVTYGRAAAAA